jgi:hypothetical protein
MMINAVVVESLEADGSVRLVMLQAEHGKRFAVAFPGELEGTTDAPFEFFDASAATQFDSGLARATAKRLGPNNWRRVDNNVNLNVQWRAIPTEKGALSLYALMLPAGSLPSRISITNPHSGREFHRSVLTDPRFRRVVIYLVCTSQHGSFNFDLNADLVLAGGQQPGGRAYSDQHCVTYERLIDPGRDGYTSGPGYLPGPSLESFGRGAGLVEYILSKAERASIHHLKRHLGLPAPPWREALDGALESMDRIRRRLRR